jgi:hypothetical protein
MTGLRGRIGLRGCRCRYSCPRRCRSSWSSGAARSVTDPGDRGPCPDTVAAPGPGAVPAPASVAAAAAEPDAAAGSPQRAWRSQAPPKEKGPAFDRRATGGCQAPLPWAPGAPRRLFATSWLPVVRESRPLRSTRIRAPAGVQYTVLCRLRSSFDGHNTVWGSPGNGLPEKRVTATRQAVETPGGGRDHPSRTNASRHRRAASRSPGATSAERDGRPVNRRIHCSATPWSVTVPDGRDR